MQKKNEEIEGIKLLVFMVDIAIKAPIKYAPLSPKNIWAFGKLYLTKITIIKHTLNKKYAKLSHRTKSGY